MLVIIGYVIVAASVSGGFALAGGHLGALFQPVELLMIGGAAVGAFFVGNSGKTIKATLKALPLVFKGAKYTKESYSSSRRAPSIVTRTSAFFASSVLMGGSCPVKIHWSSSREDP